MSSPRRLLAATAAAACLIVLAACGEQGTPNANPTGQGTLGDATATPTVSPSSPAPSSPAPTTTTTTNQPPPNPYPNNARDYGLEILKAIANDNDSRIVDLSSLNTAQYVEQQNYKSKNGQWVYANCQSGSTQTCNYYNQTGDFAMVMIDSSRLGRREAVSSVNIEGSTFASDAANYVGDFVYAWNYLDYAHMRAHATQAVVEFANGHQKLTAGGGGVTTQMVSCPPGNSGRVCAQASATGGSLTIDYTFIVDPNKLGKPNAIVGAVD
jgi:hypothetical protein